MIATAHRYALERGLAISSRRALLYAVGSLERSLGRSACVCDFQPDTVNRWLADLIDRRNPETAKSYRRQLLTLWRWSAEAGLVPAPARVRKIRPPTKPPRAWGEVELGQLLATCAGLRKRLPLSRTSRADFYRAFVLVAYDSGLRLGDLLDLRHEDIAGGVLVAVQSKTQQTVVCRLSDPCQAALAALARDGPKVFRVSQRGLQAGFAGVLKRAGLAGSIKRLRASGATACEIAAPGSAAAYLGHKTPGLAARHYLDPRLLARHKPRPPAIAGH